MKKTTPDDPRPARIQRDDHQYDETTRRLLDELHASAAPDLNSLKPTCGHAVGPHSPFVVQPDVRALDALLHISMMLKSAEEVSDEITEQASGIERGLVWSLVHSVEMARSLVDALLEGNGIEPQA